MHYLHIAGPVPEAAGDVPPGGQPEKVLAEAAAEALAQIRPHPHRADGSLPEVQALLQALLVKPGKAGGARMLLCCPH